MGRRDLDVKVERDSFDRDAWRVLIGVVHGGGATYDVLPIPFPSRRDADTVATVIRSLGRPHFDAAETERERRWRERTFAR